MLNTTTVTTVPVHSLRSLHPRSFDASRSAETVRFLQGKPALERYAFRACENIVFVREKSPISERHGNAERFLCPGLVAYPNRNASPDGGDLHFLLSRRRVNYCNHRHLKNLYTSLSAASP